MLARTVALVALLLTLPLYADVLSPELAVSPPHWQPGDVHLRFAIAHGTTRSYEAVQDGELIFGNEVLPNFEPDLSTWRFLGNGHLVGVGAIGNEFFVASDTKLLTDIRVLRVRDGKETRIAAEHNGVSFTSDGTRLLITYSLLATGTGILLDRDLNLIVPPLTISTTADGTPFPVPLTGQFFVVTPIYVLIQGTPETNGVVLIDDGGTLQTVSRPIPSGGSLMATGPELRLFFYGDALFRTAFMQRYSPTLDPIGDPTLVAKSDVHAIIFPLAMPFGNDDYVSWMENGDLYVRRRSVDEKILIASGVYGGVTLGPGSVLAKWQDPGGNLLIRRVDMNDTPHPPVYTPAEERLPSIASDGVTSMVAWAENDVRVSRIGRDGSALDGAGIVVSQSAIHPSGALQILFDGDRYIVFWSDGNAIFARYVQRDGTPSGDAFRVSPDGQIVSRFNVAWTGTRYLLSWNGALATMPPGGQAALLPWKSLPAWTFAGVGSGPRPIAVGNGFTGRVTAAFLDNGESVDIARTTDGASSFHIASNGRDYVVTWMTQHSTGYPKFQATVWAARIDAAGRVLGVVLPITTLDGAELPFPGRGIESPDSAGVALPLFDGTNYRIVYAGATLGEAILSDDAFVCACFARTEVPFDTSSMEKLSAAIAAGGSVIAYNRQVGMPDGASIRDRVFVRFANVPPPPKRHAAGH